MKHYKKIILTLVALMALTTGAWAQGKLIYEKDFTSDATYPFYFNQPPTGATATISGDMLVLTNQTVQTNNWDVQPEIGSLTSAITQGNTYRVVMQYKTTVAGSVTFALGSQQDWNNADWREQTITISDEFQTCEAYFDDYPYSIAESHILLQFGKLAGTITIKKVEVYELYPFDGISWTASTKTATIAEMPAGNVVVVPEFYDEAAFAVDKTGETPVTLAPKANNSAKANTDDPLVEGGTVANIVEGMEVLDAKQGKLLYHVSTTELTNDQLEALNPENDWSETVPTADGFTFETATNVYVYYYIQGADNVQGNAADSKFTFSDTEIQMLTVNVQPEPTYTVEFAEGVNPAEPADPEWTANPNAGVKKGQTVTVTYTGSKKVIGVKAEKKAAAKTLAEATSEDIGKIAGKDGNIYATKADAEAVATGNAVAMIAYVGTASECAHGLAIALADESDKKDYGAAGTACSGKAAVTVGTWRLPSDKDWQYMFIGCGSSESYSAPTWAMSKSYSGLASKLTTAQGAALQTVEYWSSTKDDPNGAWIVVFNGSNATFYMDVKTSEYQVRACLAF